jgi:hypothetical protein
VNDYASGLEIVSTLQAYLAVRFSTLPTTSRHRREQRSESQDYGSLELDAVTLERLGMHNSPSEIQDVQFAKVRMSETRELIQMLHETIAPRLYRLMSNALPAVHEDDTPLRRRFVKRLAQLWADCAVVMVIDHRLQVCPEQTWLTSRSGRHSLIPTVPSRSPVLVTAVAEFRSARH